MQGESVTAFVRRFRLYERKLKDAKLEPYPDETRAIKLLDGLKLDERAASSLLLAAGNRYNFDSIIEAIRILTGLARHPLAVATGRSRPQGRYFAGGSRGRGRGGSFKWKTWHTTYEDEPAAEPQVYETVPEDLVQFEAESDDDTFEYQYGEEEELYMRTRPMRPCKMKNSPTSPTRRTTLRSTRP